MLIEWFHCFGRSFYWKLSQLVFHPNSKATKRKGSDPTDKFRGYLHGKASKGDSGMCFGARDQRVGKFLRNFVIKHSEFLKKVHPILSCEYVHYLAMCIDLGGVGGLLPHKMSYHFTYASLENQMWTWKQQFLKKNRETERLCFFLGNRQKFFYVFPPPKGFISSSKVNHFLHIFIFNGGMHRTYLLSPRIVLKPVFSPFKTTNWPSCRTLLSLL